LSKLNRIASDGRNHFIPSGLIGRISVEKWSNRGDIDHFSTSEDVNIDLKALQHWNSAQIGIATAASSIAPVTNLIVAEGVAKEGHHLFLPPSP